LVEVLEGIAPCFLGKRLLMEVEEVVEVLLDEVFQDLARAVAVWVYLLECRCLCKCPEPLDR
jgi:hypothetical protein